MQTIVQAQELNASRGRFCIYGQKVQMLMLIAGDGMVIKYLLNPQPPHPSGSWQITEVQMEQTTKDLLSRYDGVDKDALFIVIVLAWILL